MYISGGSWKGNAARHDPRTLGDREAEARLERGDRDRIRVKLVGRDEVPSTLEDEDF
jgi:hypothetical protein